LLILIRIPIGYGLSNEENIVIILEVALEETDKIALVCLRLTKCVSFVEKYF
jgi:hypothetical protein